MNFFLFLFISILLNTDLKIFANCEEADDYPDQNVEHNQNDPVFLGQEGNPSPEKQETFDDTSAQFLGDSAIPQNENVETTTVIGNATLYQEFLEHITIPRFKSLDESSVVIYGIRKEFGDHEELFQYILDFLRNTAKLFHLSASDLMTVRMLGSPDRKTSRPIHVSFRTMELKDQALRSRKFVRENGFRLEAFMNKDSLSKLQSLLTFMRRLRVAGHFSVVRDGNLFVDNIRVSSSRKDLQQLFPYISAENFEGL